MRNVTVVSSGGWGTALALVLCANGHSVRLLSYTEEEATAINAARENVPFLPGIKLPEELIVSADAEESLKNAEFVINATASQYIRATFERLAPAIGKNAVLVNASKGIEGQTLLRISEVFSLLLPDNPFAALSGPSHAEEVSRNVPTAVVAAADDNNTACAVQNLFMSQSFRVYTSSDVVGVELAGALKNVIALAAGVSDGIGCGDNTKAALITRGLAEITRLGVNMGADKHTFAGLAGIGDLVVTCTSMHSRNRRCGILLGEGKSLKEALSEIAMTVEGVFTASAAKRLGEKYNSKMPIILEVNNILFDGKSPKDAVLDLMKRGKTAE